MNELALFAGAGGGILGGKLNGWRTVCAVEFDEYARNVLVARQNDGTFPPFPIWDDVTTFDGRPWRGLVDVVSGGFPCQDISCAGKGCGLDGERSGLWSEMARIISEVRPRYVFVENSPMLVSRGLDRVLFDLAEMGFDAKWGVIGASDTAAFHKRERIWIVATSNANGAGLQEKRSEQQAAGLEQYGKLGENMAHADKIGPQGEFSKCKNTQGRQAEERQTGPCAGEREWPPEPGLGRVVGVAWDILRKL